MLASIPRRVAVAGVTVVLLGLILLWSPARFAARTLLSMAGLGAYGTLEENELARHCNAFLRQNELAKAESFCVKALAIDPRHSIRRSLAELRFKQGRYAEAGVEVRKHLEAYPRDGLAVLLWMEIEKGLGRTGSVRETLFDARRRLVERRVEVQRLEGTATSRESAKHARRLLMLDAQLDALNEAISELEHTPH